MDDLYRINLTLAREGDEVAAKWLIRDFCSTINKNRRADGTPHFKPSGTHTHFYEPQLDYFRSCFEQILDGVPADKALGINNGIPGRLKISDEVLRQREYEWCLEIIRLRNSGRYDLLKHAKKAVARKFNVSVSAIDKAWKKRVAKYSAMITIEIEKEGK